MPVSLKLVRDLPLQQQLYDQLRGLILSGRLAHGSRMPSTRNLAEQFSIARITVLLTYERLTADGYITTIPAKGTFVTYGQERCSIQNPDDAREVDDAADALSRVGRPDPKLFPAGRWRAQMRAAVDMLGTCLGTEQPDGDPALVQAIIGWLSVSRGLMAHPGQIIHTNGRQHGIHLIAHVLVKPNDRVVVESPCDPRYERLLATTGAVIERVPVDDQGIRTDLLPQAGVAMALVTPEHQRPTGAVLSEERRKALIAWAERTGAMILADNIDNEVRYDSTMPPPLMRFDRNRHVILLRGFGLSLGPGIQRGYLVVPSRLAATVREAGRLIDDHAGRLEASALAGLLASGAYGRHLLQLQKTYLNRRDALIRAMRRVFGPGQAFSGGSAGLHVVWTPPSHLSETGLIATEACRAGLDAVALDDWRVCLGFGSLEEGRIEAAVDRLAQYLAAARGHVWAQTGD